MLPPVPADASLPTVVVAITEPLLGNGSSSRFNFSFFGRAYEGTAEMITGGLNVPSAEVYHASSTLGNNNMDVISATLPGENSSSAAAAGGDRSKVSQPSAKR